MGTPFQKARPCEIEWKRQLYSCHCGKILLPVLHHLKRNRENTFPQYLLRVDGAIEPKSGVRTKGQWEIKGLTTGQKPYRSDGEACPFSERVKSLFTFRKRHPKCQYSTDTKVESELLGFETVVCSAQACKPDPIFSDSIHIRFPDAQIMRL
ncbi:unnamed protein product [Protopolystoma xenopodis]|uniref:Uncharacterized protein n=1 Tax=Protopolystoma xenopodis TaxID=117903 RepID=A0A3S5CUV1_9PLAT|nr:unnamed protein product [Protopolystoma xenopodis]